LTQPGGLGKSTSETNEEKEEKEEKGEGEEGADKGKEDKKEEGEEEEEKKKDDRDIFELIREEVESEKQLLTEMESQEVDVDDKVPPNPPSPSFPLSSRLLFFFFL
jgi:hypothetical protein